MKLIWGRRLTCKGFELIDWEYHWYGIQFWSWGIGISTRRRYSGVPKIGIIE